MKKKILGFLLCFCLMAGMMSGCGEEKTPVSGNTEQTDNDLSNEPDNGEAAGTIEPTVEPTTEPAADLTPEPTQEPTPDPGKLAFSEKKKIQFSEPKKLSLPCYGYLYSSSNSQDKVTSTAQLSRNNVPADYIFQSIEKSEPDADGNITYTIVWDVYVTYSIDVLDVPWEYFGGTEIAVWALFDYYTGTQLNPKENSSNELDITWEDNTYHISCTWTIEIIDSEQIEMDQYNYMEWRNGNEHRLEVTAPADYDGLVLYINGGGFTKEDSLADNPEFGSIQDLDPDKFIFIRVDDCIQ